MLCLLALSLSCAESPPVQRADPPALALRAPFLSVPERRGAGDFRELCLGRT